MRIRQTLLGISVALAMVVIAFGIIYLLASHHPDRLWGLLAAVLAGAYIVWALRTSSRGRAHGGGVRRPC